MYTVQELQAVKDSVKNKGFYNFFQILEVRIIFQFIVGLSLPDNPNQITLLIYKILKLHQKRLKD